MTLDDLLILGAYQVASAVDIYTDGRHVCLGNVMADGSVELSDVGRAFANAALAKKVLEVLSVELPIIDVAAGISAPASDTYTAPTGTATVVADLAAMPNDLSALDAALAS